MGKLSLVAFDTNHIKRYVFATDRLREIRGASSLLDHLNRRVMRKIAEKPEFKADTVYTNGGSGLFLVDASVARTFALNIQQEYRSLTKGGASITFAIQELPTTIQDRKTAWEADISGSLRLLRYRLTEKKLSWLAVRSEPGGEAAALQFELNDPIPFASHPFMRPCDGCGQYYAEGQDRHPPAGEAVGDHLYCDICLAKREEDYDVKHGLYDIIERRRTASAPRKDKKRPFAWEQVLGKLPPEEYDIPLWADRPEDFNEVGAMSKGAKEYLAVIYADGNSMGQVFENLSRLKDIEQTAKNIDDAIYEAIASAIKKHLGQFQSELW